MSSNVQGNQDVRRGWTLGPGFLITAAFIGPGTVTTAISAGLRFDQQLLWVIMLASASAMVLQEMAGRLGLVLRRPLGAIIRDEIHSDWLRWLTLSLVLVAILFGNTAYQSGNLLGAAKGLDLLLDGCVFAAPLNSAVTLTVLAAVAGALLWSGNPRLVRRTLTALVVLMSLLFLWVAVQTRPSGGDMWRGLLPSWPIGAATTILALFGTTIVPYNLFLYASLVTDRWSPKIPLDAALRESRIDMILAIGLGGLVTAAICLVGAAAGPSQQMDFRDLPQALSHLLPLAISRWLLGVGLLAAGLTSAITAPLAAAYAAVGLLHRTSDERSALFRSVWGSVLGLGWLAAVLLQGSPQQAIILAQAANGLMLPLVAVLLWLLASRSSLLGAHANRGVVRLLSLMTVLVISLVWLASVTRRWWPM